MCGSNPCTRSCKQPKKSYRPSWRCYEKKLICHGRRSMLAISRSSKHWNRAPHASSKLVSLFQTCNLGWSVQSGSWHQKTSLWLSLPSASPRLSRHYAWLRWIATKWQKNLMQRARRRLRKELARTLCSKSIFYSKMTLLQLPRHSMGIDRRSLLQRLEPAKTRSESRSCRQPSRSCKCLCRMKASTRTSRQAVAASRHKGPARACTFCTSCPRFCC
mmetsp:Transcript_22105/g.50821  ORF Transcript_22105/g.50821 Transcript_22105/m.50821 type:complete len:217 (-) Transcript_22105:474-1124(-)